MPNVSPTLQKFSIVPINPPTLESGFYGSTTYCIAHVLYKGDHCLTIKQYHPAPDTDRKHDLDDEDADLDDENYEPRTKKVAAKSSTYLVQAQWPLLRYHIGEVATYDEAEKLALATLADIERMLRTKLFMKHTNKG